MKSGLDEAQHWLLARDSNSIADLWRNTRYEGHPLLWNLVLYGITRFTHDPIWMQLAHWSISVVAAAVFIFSSPFRRSWNVLFVFGYFMMFEYTMLSRNYSLLLLFFFLSLRFYVTSRYVSLGISLFLLSNTHLFGLIMAGWLAMLILLFDTFNDQLPVAESRSRKLVLFIFLAGALLSLAQISPPGDSPFLPSIGALFSHTGLNDYLQFF